MYLAFPHGSRSKCHITENDINAYYILTIRYAALNLERSSFTTVKVNISLIFQLI